MPTYTVQRDGERDISFVGEQLARVETSPEQSFPNYSGSVGRWTVLELYRTAGGTFVCSRRELSQWEGAIDTHEAAVAHDEAQVAAFFGFGNLAKELYRYAGLDTDERIE